MGQVASAGDNADMESFFAPLQKNVLDRRRWATRHALRLAIITWIERTYHRRRRQVALDRLTPIEYETIMTTPAPRPPNPTCHRNVQQSLLLTLWVAWGRLGGRDLAYMSRCDGIETMHIASGLLTVDDYQRALDDEYRAARRLLPNDDAISQLFRHEGASAWAQRRCAGEFAPVPGQIVTVRKSGHGVRPVAELSVRDRVLYRALVSRWKDALSSPDRSTKAYDTFLEAPLCSETAPAYVVSSDVTACYEYVDHGLLGREVLARTGDSDGVEALINLLGGLMGRSYGLPQQSGASDVLAEAYLSVVERRLLRQGLAVWRYNDDFRIPVDGWSDALNAVDALERECRSMGLALNDLKTVIRKGETYKQALGRRAETMQEISREVELDLTDIITAPYEDVVVVRPEKDEVEVAAAHQIVAQWATLQHKMLTSDHETGLTPDETDKRGALTELLRWALTALKSETTDNVVLAACAQILRSEQTLTPYVARYIEKQSDSATTVQWFESFLSENPYLTPWQAWWVAPSLRAGKGSYREGSRQRSWLQLVWQDRACPEPVKAGIALTVAQNGLSDVSNLLEVYEGMTETGRPFLARAIGAIATATDAGAATLLDEDEWVKWAFQVGQDGA